MIQVLRTAFGALLLLASVQATAQERGPEGRWALRAGGRTLLILELARTRDEIGQWVGSLAEPARIRWEGSPTGFSFAGIEGPVVERRIRPARPMNDGVSIVLAEDVPGQPDSFHFTVAADGTGALTVDNFPLAPLYLVRADPGEAVAGAGWSPSRHYAADVDWTTNTEMTAIFDADQADRRGAGAAIDWSVVGPRDQARRARTLALLNVGALRSGDDFWHAAFVFQHGDRPNDYLLAHTLAVIAAARGRPDATWIAAATLDRYLQNIGQAQIYGTQFRSRPGQATTQEPYERSLVSDALRQALGVPPQAAQESQRAQFEAEARAAEAQRAPRH